jgi:hypothetical protein
MIFWNGNRIANLILDGICPEAMYYNYVGRSIYSNVYHIRKAAMFRAFVYRNFVIIYNSFVQKKTNYIDKIPIVSDTTDIDDFPDRFAIKTKNIDLLRELIARGKKVSWIDPDLFTQAHFLALLNFEHVFLDPYINTHIIFPTGKVVKSEDVLHVTAIGMWTIRYAKRIGFNLKFISGRIDWRSYRISRLKKKKHDTSGPLGRAMVTNFYNIYSLTYLVWRQSKPNVMIAKKKIAPKE